MHYSRDLAHAIRFLSVDAVEKAQSGHPGMPLGMADVATVLWKSFLKHNPTNPHWFNRDRFVLSNGHGSMLLYALLHLTGYALDIAELKNFRQLHSKTPGHPEWSETPGVETTTGPLAQGLANAVGMALAEQRMAREFNGEDGLLVNHYTYAFVGDGCLMEGLSHEACSLAGTWGLGKLIVFYDANGISIDGPIDDWFTDDTTLRFKAYNWHVVGPIDGHDFNAIETAIQKARANHLQPSLIICKTTIGYGALLAGSEKTHGAPLGAEDIIQLRQKLHWPYEPFVIPKALYEAWDHTTEGTHLEQLWLQYAHDYQTKQPQRYHEFLRRINGDLPDSWPEDINTLMSHEASNHTKIATRKASLHCLRSLTPKLPELLGGSADLTESNCTDCGQENYIHYGVREFGMAAIMTGLALHGGFIPYGGTFLVFSDYARNAMRMSALMHQRVIYVLTHDSIGLGEDGPTHQPIEHINMLRMTPNMHVWRPADALETAVAWKMAIENHRGPSCIVLSRQALPVISRTFEEAQMIGRGGYILKDSEKKPDIILIATGSEVTIALESAAQVLREGIHARVVSMPCAEQFLAQDDDHQQHILPNDIRCRLAIEAGATHYWYRFVGLDGAVMGIDEFGASAPAPDVYRHLNLTMEQTVARIKSLVKLSGETHGITHCN